MSIDLFSVESQVNSYSIILTSTRLRQLNQQVGRETSGAGTVLWRGGGVGWGGGG